MNSAQDDRVHEKRFARDLPNLSAIPFLDGLRSDYRWPVEIRGKCATIPAQITYTRHRMISRNFYPALRRC